MGVPFYKSVFRGVWEGDSGGGLGWERDREREREREYGLSYWPVSMQG